MNKVLVIGYPCRLCGCDLTKGGPKFSLLGGKELSTRPDYTAAFETLVGPVRLGDGLSTAICSECRELLGSYVQTKATLDHICSAIKSMACKTHNATMDLQAASVNNIDCATDSQIKAEIAGLKLYPGEHAIKRTSSVCPLYGNKGMSQITLSCLNQKNIKYKQTPKSPDAPKCIMLPKSSIDLHQKQNALAEKVVKVVSITPSSKRLRILKGKWESVGECLVQGRYHCVVRPLMAMPDVVPSVVTAVLELIKKECKKLRNRCSVLKQTSVFSLAEFEWDKVVEEWENLAPTLLRFLKAACGMADSWKPETIADLDKENRMAMAGSILLNVRCPSLNAPLYVNGIELYKAGVKCRTFPLLRRIGFCMDYVSVIAKLKESAEGKLILRKGHTSHTPASVNECTMDTEEQEKSEEDQKEQETQDTDDAEEHHYQQPLESEAEILDPEPDSTALQSHVSPSQENVNSSDEGEEEEELNETEESEKSRKRRTDTEMLDSLPALSQPFKVMRNDGDDDRDMKN